MRASAVILSWWLLAAGVHAAPPPAPPLATLRIDVDGDGRAEDAVLDAGGRLAVGAPGGALVGVAIAGAGESLRAPATIVGVPDGKRALLVVTAAIAGGAGERVAIVGGGGKPEILFSERLGPEGRDGEWSRRLIVDGDAILLGDERPGVARCDAPRALLHPRRFVSGPKPEFKPVSIAPRAPAGSSAIDARAAAPAGAEGKRPLLFRVEAASSVRGDGGTAESLAIPREVDDGDPKTAWHEGRGGWGRGEFVTARARARAGRLAAIGIVGGDGASPAAWTAANRLKQIHVVLDDRTLVVDVPNTPSPQPQWITLPQPVATRCVSIVVAEVWPGREADHTAIAELVLLTDDELAQAGGLGGLVDELARGGPGAGGAARVLVDAGPPGATALAKKLAASTGGGDAPARRRLAVALAAIGGAEHVELLVRALGELPASATGDRDALARGLERIGEPAVAALSRLMSEDDAVLEGRIAAAGVLGALPGDGARVALTALVGGATPGLTRAVLDALARRPAAEHAALLAAADAAGVSSTRVTILRALSKALGLDAALAAQVRARALAAATAADGAPAWRVIAADALGRLIDATSADALARLLDAGGPPEPRVAALAALPADAPATVVAQLQRALADRDPGVRAAALVAGGAALIAADPPAMHRVLLRDHWPALRGAAARRLEGRCDRATTDALWAVDMRDPDDGVHVAALGALVACKTPGVGVRLLELVRDDDASPSLRAGAARLVGPLADPRATALLAAALAGLREDALAHPEVAVAAVAAARSLGALGGPAALRALADAVDDPAEPGAQAAAIEAYAARCPTGAAAKIRRASGGAPPVVARAARLALDHCSH